MNFIDIASHQDGMDLEAVFKKNATLDGVIVKVSEGTGFVTPQAKAWLDWLIGHGKPAGTYHYLNLAGAEAEARHYAKSVKPWLGKVALAIDYEADTLRKGTGYLKACLDEVYRLTGVKPMVYCSQCSTLEAQDFSAIAAAGYPLWVAQYADYAPVHGFLKNPWHTGSSSPFKAYAMRQYTSQGYLDGWSENLDFDLFYGTAEDWRALCGSTGGSEVIPPSVVSKDVDPVVIADVLANRYGAGDDRKKNLESAGYSYDAVQKKVNELYVIAEKIAPVCNGNKAYLNSIIKIARKMIKE